MADKRLLLSLSTELEEHAHERSESTVMLSSFQRNSVFTSGVAERYSRLSESMALVGALGMGPDPQSAPGVRWGELEPTDPLVGEWDIAVVGPHFAVVFVASDLGDQGADLDRRFEFAMNLRPLAGGPRRAGDDAALLRGRLSARSRPPGPWRDRLQRRLGGGGADHPPKPSAASTRRA